MTALVVTGFLVWPVARPDEDLDKAIPIGVRFREGATYEFRVTRWSRGEVRQKGLSLHRAAEAVDVFTLSIQSLEEDGTVIADVRIEHVSLEVNGSPRPPPSRDSSLITIRPDGQLQTEWGLGIPSPISSSGHLPDWGQIIPVVPPRQASPGEEWIHRSSPGPFPGFTVTVGGRLEIRSRFLGYVPGAEGERLAQVHVAYDGEDAVHEQEIPVEGSPPGKVITRIESLHPTSLVILLDAETGELMSMSGSAFQRVTVEWRGIPAEQAVGLLAPSVFRGQFGVEVERTG